MTPTLSEPAAQFSRRFPFFRTGSLRVRKARACALPPWARAAAREVAWIRRHVLFYDNTDLAIAIHDAYLRRKR